MKTLIIAPHIDDELIGCWSVLNDLTREITVAWLYDLTPERVLESQNLKVAHHLYGGEALRLDLANVKKKYREVYVPSRYDWHQDHRQTNADYRRMATHFYSVDMFQGTYLGEEAADLKRRQMDKLYPSQKELWEKNAKYYLFESIHKDDFTTMTTFVWTDFSGENFVITVPAQRADDARFSLDVQSMKMSMREVLDVVLTRTPRGRVRVQQGDHFIETGE